MKVAKYTIGIAIGTFIFFFGLFLWQQRNIEKKITDYWFPPKGKTINNYEVIRCDYNFLRPTVVFISDQIILDKYPELAIYFSTMENTFFQIKESYLGVSTVKNTTFEELAKMVKEDCSQFQKGYLDYTGYEHLSEQEKDDRYWEIAGKNLQWTYSEYKPEPPEPALSEEEKKLKEEWEEIMRKRYEENSKNYKKIEHTIIEE